MKQNVKRNIFFIISALLIITSGCTQKHHEIQYNYKGVLLTGESVDLKFCVCFKDSASKEIAKRRQENFMHALEILFPSYKYSQLNKSKVRSILKKASSQVFYDTVEGIHLISLKYGK